MFDYQFRRRHDFPPPKRTPSRQLLVQSTPFIITPPSTNQFRRRLDVPHRKGPPLWQQINIYYQCGGFVVDHKNIDVFKQYVSFRHAYSIGGYPVTRACRSDHEGGSLIKGGSRVGGPNRRLPLINGPPNEGHL